jgi:DnaK suppressor protein
MKQQFISKIKKLLEDQYFEIIELSKLTPKDIDIEGDDIDEIQGKIIAHSNAQIYARNKDKLSKIKLAFQKISEGEYGLCEECGDDISEKRLEANPIFTTCISCAEEKEFLAKKARI